MATRREIELDFLARDRSAGAVNSFGRNLRNAGDAAERAARSARDFGDDSERAGRGADELGDEAAQTERQLSRLQREIDENVVALTLLGRAFADAGNDADRLDISRQVRQVENDTRRLEGAQRRIRQGITPDAPDPSRLAQFGAKLSDSLSGMANPVGAALGVGIGAAVGPTLMQALSTAASGAIAAAGIGAGVALAVSKDQGIQDAGKSIGKKLLAGLQDEASKSFGGPIRSALGILEDAAGRIQTKLGGLFRSLSDDVVPFTRDLVQAGERIIDMFVSVGSESGTALAALGDSVRLIVDGVADFFEELSGGGQNAADSLTLVAGGIADIIRWVGKLIGAFNDLSSSPWLGIWPTLKAHYREQAQETDTMAGSNTKLAETFTNAEKAARGELSAMEALSNELRAQTDPVFGLLNAQDKLKAAQDKVSESTKKNGADSRETKSAMRELAEAALNLEGQAGKLGGAFDGKMTPALRATLKAAGLTDDQVGELEQQFKTARTAAGKFAGNYKANVSAPGAKTVWQSLFNVRDAANSIPRAVTIAMRITGVTNVSKQAAAIRKQAEARAAGGPVVAGRPYWVGEEGPELIMPNHNGVVLNARKSRGAARRLFDDQPGFSPGRVGTTKVVMETAGPEEIRTFLRYMIRSMNLLQG